MANFDPVTLEILWSRLISIADESAAALLRTSFSTIVRESNDFATVLMDANGDSLAENTAGIPSFVGMLPEALKNFINGIAITLNVLSSSTRPRHSRATSCSKLARWSYDSEMSGSVGWRRSLSV